MKSFSCNPLALFVVLNLSIVANALSFNIRSAFRSDSSTQRFYKDSNDNEYTTSQSLRLGNQVLPMGAFGILPPPSQQTNNQNKRIVLEAPNVARVLEVVLDKPDFVVASEPPSASFKAELDLPVSATRSAVNWTVKMEDNMGRIAMIAATILFSTEMISGMSLPQQLDRLLGV